MSRITGTSIEVFGGRLLDLADPQPDQIELSDIAHALGNTCRFGGHIKRYYSVAEHSMNGARIVAANGGTLTQVLGFLMHDAHEAYIGDLPTPLKTAIRATGDNGYDAIRRKLDNAIADKFNLPVSVFDDELIHGADLAVLIHEGQNLLTSGGQFLGADTSGLIIPDLPTLGEGPIAASAKFFDAVTETINQKENA